MKKKLGRPRKGKEEKRYIVISFKVTPDERDTLEALAETLRITKSELIRSWIPKE